MKLRMVILITHCASLCQFGELFCKHPPPQKAPQEDIYLEGEGSRTVF